MKKPVELTLIAIIAIMLVVEILIFTNIARFPFIQISILGTTDTLTHWLAWAGALFIAFATPVQPIIKRGFPKYFSTSLNIHMIGNLIAVFFISIHFVEQVTLPEFQIGTGTILYATVILLAAAGFVMYLGIDKKYKKFFLFLHQEIALIFYIILIIHVFGLI